MSAPRPAAGSSASFRYSAPKRRAAAAHDVDDNNDDDDNNNNNPPRQPGALPASTPQPPSTQPQNTAEAPAKRARPAHPRRLPALPLDGPRHHPATAAEPSTGPHSNQNERHHQTAELRHQTSSMLQRDSAAAAAKSPTPPGDPSAATGTRGRLPAPNPTGTAASAAAAKETASAPSISPGHDPATTRPRAARQAAPRRLVIRPLRNAPRMPDTFLKDAWTQYLLPAVLAVQHEEPMGFSLEMLYANVEDACMHGHAPELYDLLSRACSAHVATLVARIAEGKLGNAEPFLALIDDIWRHHCSQMLRIRAIFLKLDRAFVAKGSTSNARSLWDMGLQQFCCQLTGTPDVERKTVEGLIALVNRERDGDAIDHARLHSLLRMFSAVGTYERAFERPFLLSTSDYYKAEAERLIVEADIPAYLRHAELRLNQELERAVQDLDPTTRKPLISIAEQRLVADHVTTILDKGFDGMCNGRQLDDLRRCFTLFARANHHTVASTSNHTSSANLSNSNANRDGDGGGFATGSSVEHRLTAHEAMRAHIIKYIKRVGLAIVMDVEKDGDMVQNLLDLKARFDELVTKAFDGLEMFVDAMNYSFKSFVNARENKPAELIAKFLDGILRTGNKAYSEDALENTLDRALILFRYIEGKDVFEAFYKKDLSKRLLYDKSASHDLEKLMISKLKAECGSQFTSKLEAMFRDVDASKDLMTSFRQTQSNYEHPVSDQAMRLEDGGNGASVFGASDAMELNVFVLEAARWPLATQRADVKLPQELLDRQESYKRFYLSKHAGRKLTWQHFDGSCVINAYFPKGTKILSLSLYQTVVMVLFNHASRLSLQEIGVMTGIDDKELRRTLLSLACGKVRVLHKVPKGPTVNDGDVFVYNESFVHKQTRIKVNAIQMKETLEENTGTTAKVFQERSYQIDASLVRIMKTRKSLDHTALINEMYNQLRFKCNTSDIKRRIESLIEREYIERDADNPQLYLYVA